jgi:SAM-dependent methyltransferase
LWFPYLIGSALVSPLVRQKIMKPHVADERASSPGPRSAPQGGYDPSFFDELAAIEDQHFWFRARNRLIFDLAKKICSQIEPGYLVLEVGCGTGNVLRALRDACSAGRVVGLELWFDGLRHAQRRVGDWLVQGDVRSLPFGRQFNLVGLFDVLEHLPEERETLRAVHGALVPGGKLMLTVPAHQFLWSYFDEAAHHCRRYSETEIRERLVEAGFHVEYLSQFMACIFPIVWAFRKAGNFWSRSDSETSRNWAAREFRIVPGVNWVLTSLLTLEARWLASGHRLGFGTSFVVIATKS